MARVYSRTNLGRSSGSNLSPIAKRGFTIVELIIVIVVIGILATIVTVAYQGVARTANEKEAKNDVIAASLDVKRYKANNSRFPNSLADAGVTSAPSGSTYRYSLSDDGKTFCLSATKNEVSYYLTESVTSPTAGECPTTIAWVESTSLYGRQWQQVFIAADGQHVMARASNYGNPYVSADGGATWTVATIGGSGSAKAFDFTPDGRLGVVTNSTTYGTTYLSSNYGQTWNFQSAGARLAWNNIVISADGNTMIGTLNSMQGKILKATRYNKTDPNHPYYNRVSDNGQFNPLSPTVPWISIDASDDLTRIVGASLNGSIYTYDGTSWIERTSAGNRNWQTVATSSDGSFIVAGVHGGYIYTSADGGDTWTERTEAGSRNWIAVSTNSDGTKLIAADNGGYLYTSGDSGATWTQAVGAGQRPWTDAMVSSAGTAYIASAGYPCPPAGSGCSVVVGRVE